MIKFFGKFLPMYRPISDVVDSITPSISHRIQSSSMIWRNQSAAAYGRPPMVSASRTTANGPAKVIDPCNDITFEYVSFKDQMTTLPPQSEQPEMIENKIMDLSELPSASCVNAMGIVSVKGGGKRKNKIQQRRDDFMPIDDEDELQNNNNNMMLMNGGEVVDNMQQFSNTLLDANYNYDTSSSGSHFGLELKNAIDLII